jgi:hypothetical protein
MDFTSPCEPNGRGQDLTIDDLVVAPDRHARFIRSLPGHDLDFSNFKVLFSFHVFCIRLHAL